MDTTPLREQPTQPTQPAQPVRRSGPPAVTGGLRLAAALTSGAVAALGLAWWLGDALYYFSPDGDRAGASLLTLVPQELVAALAVLLGGVGLLTALRGRGRPVAAVAAVQVLAFVAVAGDAGVLVVLGYATALLFPPLLLAALLWGAGRHRAARLGLAVLVLAVGTAVGTSGTIDADSLRDLGAGLGTGLRDKVPGHLVVGFLMGHGLLWALVGLRAARAARGACADCGRPGGSRLLVRWAGPITLVAAACGLPYFLARLTWLTANPVAAPTGELASPGVQVMGILLGVSGLVAATLTVGLLRPWGRRFPRWLPVVGGRAVPVLFPTLTAGVVGAVMAVAGRTMVQSYLQDRSQGAETEAVYLLLIPLPLWGPALVLAAAAYYLRFRGPCVACGAGDSTPGH